MKGKLIVFEGTDGSGKATQSRMLCQRLAQEQMAYQNIDFPRYGQPSAVMVQEYLDGKLGKTAGDVNAYAASILYAVDRFASYKQDWGSFYEQGGLIVADRYTTSNAVHQGCKLPEAELPQFFDWLYDLEYHKLGLPKPDLVIYLDVDIETSLARMEHRRQKYNSQADIHEKDAGYLADCLRLGHLAAAHYGWRVVPFQKDGEIRALEEKHEEIYQIVKSVL
jgi:dTMP kinase